MKIVQASNTAIEGRIERLQILRSDGTIRESKKVDIHNTIVDSGLNNLLMVNNDPSVMIDGSNANAREYARNILVRMTYFMQIGTGKGDTAFDDTSLKQPYPNNETSSFSSSHYIPAVDNAETRKQRGTESLSCAPTNISWVSRITSNSIKVDEDNVEINEVGFFVAYNDTYTTAWTSQKWNVGQMFSRINLGDNSVILNKGERLVVTYAITQYIGAAASVQPIDNLGIIKADGTPATVVVNEKEYNYGALTRTSFGSAAATRVGINTTSDTGYINREFGKAGTNVQYHLYPSYVRQACGWLGGSGDPYWQINPVMLGTQPSMRRSGSSYQAVDDYGFFAIDRKALDTGNTNSNDNPLRIAVKPTSSTDLLPYRYDNKVNEGLFWGVNNQSILEYVDSGLGYVDRKVVIPSFIPSNYPTSTRELKDFDPSAVTPIYWIVTLGMYYKIGYFTTPGLISSFIQYPLYKKAGEAIEIVFRESYTRYTGADTHTVSE